jgi:uncharacterized protein (TIGR00661 family)
MPPIKILYAIQGTGNGHISRARDIIPILQQKGSLDILISGTEVDITIPYPVKYRLKGFSYIFGKRGGVDMWASYRNISLIRLYKEIKQLPVDEYDLIITDFEPVSAWACKLKNKPCIGLSHQAAVAQKKSPKPTVTSITGKFILHHCVPVSYAYGFHFEAYDNNIFTPVIRAEIRHALPIKNNHYTVYLPAYDDENIIKILGAIKHTQWEVFSKHSNNSYVKENVHIRPIQNEAFVESLITCTGVLCGAGFETPAEALYLQKKLLVIPMKRQYEQYCNAAALKNMGVPFIKSLQHKYLHYIDQWVQSNTYIAVNYLNKTEEIINHIIANHT